MSVRIAIRNQSRALIHIDADATDAFKLFVALARVLAHSIEAHRRRRIAAVAPLLALVHVVASIRAVVIAEAEFAFADRAETVVDLQASRIMQASAGELQICTRLFGRMQARPFAVAGPTIRALTFERADRIFAHCQRMAGTRFAFVNILTHDAVADEAWIARALVRSLEVGAVGVAMASVTGKRCAFIDV